MNLHPQVIRKLKNIEEIKKLGSLHYTKNEIASMLNLSRGHIRNLCIEGNISISRVKYRKITNLEHQVIIGSILGDGSITIHKKWQNSKLVIKHSIKQKEYLEYKYSLLQRICPSGIKERLRKEKRESFHFKDFHEIHITTMANPSLNVYRDKWYTSTGRKILDKEEFKNISPLSLAIWIMDDGSFTKCGVTIASMCFTFEEVSFMKEVLEEKFGFKMSVWKDNLLYIKAESMPKLISLVWNYFPPSMKYKLVRLKSGEFRETPEVGNPDPSSMNDDYVIEKEQRLTGEESTNNPDTSAGHLAA